MQRKVLRIQMFGGFSIRYGNEAVALNKIGNSKAIRLLQMLLLSPKAGIAKSELLDSLYGWNDKTDTVNRNKNLNNLIYRLKKQLVTGGLPEDDYVGLDGGRCYFKSSIPVEVDTQQFEETANHARVLEEGAKSVCLYRKAVDMYRGELLPRNLSDVWFYHKSEYFKEVYVHAVLELEKEYIKMRDYRNRFMLYEKAVIIYPFDNWQIRQIRCNLEIYRYKEALEIYNDTLKLYSREMGSPPVAEMQKCFEELEAADDNHRRSAESTNGRKSMDKAFMERKDDIRKMGLGQGKTEGAYYCAYPSFVDYCHLVVQAKERNNFDAVLMFLTLSQMEKRGSQRDIDIQDQMQLLKTVIKSSLRAGDAYSRYGNRHFILMLVKTNTDSCSLIFQRIESAYIRESGKGELWYYADMTQELDGTAF